MKSKTSKKDRRKGELREFRNKSVFATNCDKFRDKSESAYNAHIEQFGLVMLHKQLMQSAV